MTIKTQAFLQGYLHDKTADGRDRPTPIVAAPGIPPTVGDRHIWTDAKTLFPGGKAKYKATQLQMPPTPRDAKGRESLTPASVNDQLLQNLPIPAAEFVALQRDNYERDRVRVRDLLPWNKPKVRPWSDLIDFDKRNQPVSLDTEDKSDGQPVAYIDERRIVGLDPEELRKHPKGEWVPEGEFFTGWDWKKQKWVPRQGEEEMAKKWTDYSGYPSTPDGGQAGRYDDGVPVLGHELTHTYTGGAHRSDARRLGSDGDPGTSYITEQGLEYTQGVTAGLNAMRDITGEKLNDPQQVHQLFDEIIAKPSILDFITPEHARVFRTYLTLRKTNPEAAEQLRNSMAFNSQYLVKNERVGDPMVKKAV